MRQGQLRAVLGYLHRVANPDSGGPDDAQLLDRWRNQRDPAAFEVLVWRHGALVWNVCRRILGREQDVEDAFQATFLIFLRKADTIGQGRFLGSWLYKVAYRTALAARAASVRHTEYEPLNPDLPEATTTEEHAWNELGPVLDEEVSRLPEKYRRPFVLCYLEGKTTDEAARDLGCPRGTVGTRLAWARERLRSRLTRRGVALTAVALATLLAEKAAGSVPASLVGRAVKAATFSAAGHAVAAGVISVRAVALTQEVLQALFVSKLKTVAVVLLAVGIVGSGAGLLARQDLAERTETAPTQVVVRSPDERTSLSDDGDLPSEPGGWSADQATTKETPPPPDKDEKSDPLRIAGKVVQVDADGKGLSLVIPAKTKGDTSRKAITITDKTHLVFSNVGLDEARLTEGHSADVWLEKGSKDVAARVHLHGNRNPKNAPQKAGQVVAIAAGGKGITLEKPAKSKPIESIVIQFTDRTRVLFSNVGRDGARMTVGHQALVWLDKDLQDTAKAVTFLGAAEGKSVEGKDKKPDRTGRIIGVSGKGRVLTVEAPADKGEEPATTQIRLTNATLESYHDVAADGARPVEGYRVQVWLADGSQDTAVRIRLSRPDPRMSVDARIVAVSPDGAEVTVEIPPRIKGGESARREIKITDQTRLVFSSVGPGGARLAAGYHVRGWLVEGSEDTADELMVSRSEKTGDR